MVLALIGVVGSGLGSAEGAEPARGVADLVSASAPPSVEVRRRGSDRWDAKFVPTNHSTGPDLDVGDSLRTLARSWAKLRMTGTTSPGDSPESSTIHLRESTTVSFEPPDEGRTWLRLNKGIFSFFHRGPPRRVGVRTDTASLLVWGTEFTVSVTDEQGTTEVELIDGEIELRSATEAIRLKNGERVRIAPGKPLDRTPRLEVNAALQWLFYYPAILDLDELPWPGPIPPELEPSIVAYRSGNIPQALARYPAGRRPTTSAESLYLAGALLAAGGVDESLDVMGTAVLPLAPDAVEARLGKALKRLIAAVKLAPLAPEPNPQTASEHLAQSYALQASSSSAEDRPELLERALAAAREAVRRSPHFAFAWIRVAELEFSFGRIPAARAALTQGLALAPQQAQGWSLRGYLEAAERRYGPARAAFQRALELDGRLGNAWLGRGLCQLAIGQTQAGLADLEMAAACEPHRSFLRSYLAKAFQLAGDTAHARHELQLAKALDPHDPTPYLYASLLLEQEGRFNEAIRELKQSQARNANRQVYRSSFLLEQDQAVRSANLARMYREAGWERVGLREASRAVAADPANYSAHLFLAESYDAWRDPNRVNLRYETPALIEYLIANLLAPVGAGPLSPHITQQEYSRLFDQPHLGLSSRTDYSSRGDWSETAAHQGILQQSSYAIETTKLTRRGDRPNADLDLWEVTVRLKQALSARDTLYLESQYATIESGDTRSLYDPATLHSRLRVREQQEPIALLGYHREWSPERHSLFLLGWLQDELTVQDPRQAGWFVHTNSNRGWNVQVTNRLSQAYRSQLGIYQAEAQHLINTSENDFLVGARLQTGRLEAFNLHQVADFVTPLRAGTVRQINFVDGLPSQDGSGLALRAGLYAYDQFQIQDSLRLVGGLSYDHLAFPHNFRFAPLNATRTTHSALSPKAGLLWEPDPHSTVRLAYSRLLSGFGLDQSIGLEPTQIAGINQAYRSLIPESLEAANAGSRMEISGLELERALSRDTHLAVWGNWRRARVQRDLGAYDLSQQPYHGTNLSERLRFEEQSAGLDVHHLLGQEFSVAASYQFGAARLRRIYAAVPSENLHSSYLQQLSLAGHLHHPFGFFASALAGWNQQNPSAGPTEGFWQFDLYAGFRFPRRRAEIRLGLLNLGDQSYRLDPLNDWVERPRERTFTARFQFQF